MIQSSDSFKELITANDRQIKTDITVDGIMYDDTVIKDLTYHSSISSGGQFIIGSTNASTIEVNFTKAINFRENQVVKAYCGVKNHQIFLGTFYINSVNVDKNLKTTKIKAVDKMMFLNKEYTTNLVFPTSIRSIVKDIGNHFGVTVSDRYLSGKTISKKPEESITFREMLSYLAQINNAFVIFNREGHLEFRKLNRTNEKITKNDYFLHGLVTDDVLYRINGIVCDIKDKDKTILASGSAIGTQIKLVNPLMTQSYLHELYNLLKDINFKPYKLEWRGNPCYEVGDWIQIEEDSGKFISVPILSVKLVYSGGLKSSINADVKGSSSVSYEYKGTIERQIEFLNARVGADGNFVYGGESEPPEPKEGDTWFRPNGAYTDLLIYEKGQWVKKTSTGNIEELVTKITNDEVIAPKLCAGIAKIIELDAKSITSGTIDSGRIKNSSISQSVRDSIRDGLVTTKTYNEFIVENDQFKSSISNSVQSKAEKSFVSTEILQLKDDITLEVKKSIRNLCKESDVVKYGNDLYFKTETLKANEIYRVEFEVVDSNNAESIYIFSNKLDKKKSRLGKNIHRVKYDEEKTAVNIYPCGERGAVRNVRVYKDDGGIINDEIISSINLTPESAKIKAGKIELNGEVIVNSINNGSTSINGDKIKTGSITTDMLYPGASQRIILERGYPPGANDCKSVDANGNAIRLKVNAGTYSKMDTDGEFIMFSRGNSFFAFDPNYNWATEGNGGSYSGSGKLNLRRSQINCGFVDAMLVTQWSDSKLKENLIKLDSDKDFYYRENKDTKKSRVSKEEILDFVKDCQLYEYTYKNQANQRVSLVTQEVKDKIKDLIVVKQKNESGVFASVDLYSYISLLHVALQDEMKKTEELEDRIAKIEKHLKEGGNNA